MIDDLINGAPALLAIPLAFVFRRQMIYSKAVDQHTIQIQTNQKEIELLRTASANLCEKVEKQTAEMHELIGVIREMHNHSHT